jgi:hypothetical protein
MFRRIFQLGSIFLLLVSVTIPAAASELVEVPIPPYTMGEHYTIGPGEVGVIEFGWLACTRGLVNVFVKASYFEFELIQSDESPYLVVTQDEIDDLWNPIEPAGFTHEWCRGGQKTSFSSWQVKLFDLPPGEYELHFMGGIKHSLTDGGDFDGDGTPDVFHPEDYGGNTINYITVLAP